MLDFKTPGVYIQEIPKLPPSIASVETAIPAFIGYTQKADLKIAGDLIRKPTRITSMLEYERYFGKADPETGLVAAFTGAGTSDVAVTATINPATASVHLLYYSMQLFFANGGGPCYIISVGIYPGAITNTDLEHGIDDAGTINEVTLLVVPEAVNITGGSAVAQYYGIFDKALDQCVELQDRFTVMDVYPSGATAAADLRSTLSNDVLKLKYGAAYYPRLYTLLTYDYSDETLVTVTGVGGSATLDALKAANLKYYNMAKAAINGLEMLLPAAPAVVGQYAATDNLRGVWKAPANVNISRATRPQLIVTGKQQAGLNVDEVSGKSIDVIRSFPGRGPAIIWGARTLAGNDNEWRYVPVRRFFNMVEESVKNATEQFVFEPNDQNTWTRVKSMIENYLTTQWKNGALMGASTAEAFYVHIGLGSTMTELDIWEGRMIVEIGMAVVRPAEFIVLTFMHKMLSEK
ncbi:phage tail protein [Niastella vici]|uniref:Phage tail protein n=1 Tax=Niastella vici TaxID=1703345 RepID=A0A1V9FQD7_9BACT|nr:phage tail sheath C-terminal domain-containing protein [Niastella vici]OQP60585.1 phage tail protein [Niastella vici]